MPFKETNKNKDNKDFLHSKIWRNVAPSLRPYPAKRLVFVEVLGESHLQVCQPGASPTWCVEVLVESHLQVCALMWGLLSRRGALLLVAQSSRTIQH